MSEQKDALSAALVAALQAARAVGRLQVMCGDGVASDAELADAKHAEDYARAAVERLARPAAPAEAQPVAWCKIDAWERGGSWPDDCFARTPQGTGKGWVPLYVAQPQAQTPQAPVARLNVNGPLVSASLYSPGLPDGGYDVYLEAQP